MDYQELLARLRRGNYYHAQIEEAADVIESLLAENKQLKSMRVTSGKLSLINGNKSITRRTPNSPSTVMQKWAEILIWNKWVLVRRLRKIPKSRRVRSDRA